MGREGNRLGQSIGSVWGQAGALNSMAVAYLEQGDLEKVIDSLAEARRLAEEAGMRPLVYFGLPYLVLTYLSAGAFEEADQLADQLYAERDSLIQVYRRTSLGVAAEVKIRLGQLELAERILAEAFEGLDLDGPLFGMKRLLLADAYFQLALDNPRRGLERMEYLTGRMHQAGIGQYLAEGHTLQGKALLALNEPGSARAAFLEGLDAGQETGSRRMLWQILWELSQLEAAAGDASAADRYKQEAREIVTTIADQAGSRELRASFLALPEVQAVSAG
jgi:hypothetical protein